MPIMRVGYRTPATSKTIDNCDSCYRMEAVKNSLKKLHRRYYSGSRSRLSRLIINISFMPQLECSSKWSQIYYANVPKIN